MGRLSWTPHGAVSGQCGALNETSAWAPQGTGLFIMIHYEGNYGNFII